MFRHHGRMHLAAASLPGPCGYQGASVSGSAGTSASRVWFALPPTAAVASGGNNLRLNISQQMIHDDGRDGHGIEPASTAPLDSLVPSAAANVSGDAPAAMQRARVARSPTQSVDSGPREALRRACGDASGSAAASGVDSAPASTDLEALFGRLQQHIDGRFDRLEARVAACEAALGALVLGLRHDAPRSRLTWCALGRLLCHPVRTALHLRRACVCLVGGRCARSEPCPAAVLLAPPLREAWCESHRVTPHAHCAPCTPTPHACRARARRRHCCTWREATRMLALMMRAPLATYMDLPRVAPVRRP